jgi:long-chain fatty acid transport protein
MKLTKIAVLVASIGVSASAFATNGYFSDGFGIKAKGMAGVGIAMPQDSLAAATNPAGITEVGDRLDIGLEYFMPRRSVDISGTGGAGWDGSYSGDGMKNFLIPEFGYNKKLGWDMAVGIAVYGNGGMNTHYNNNPFAAGPFAGAGQNPGGVNLEQLFIAPTFAMKLNKDHSVGASLVYGYQRFGATGLQAFALNPGWTAAGNAGNVTNNGYDHSDGWGLRLGWTGKVSDSVTLGATYATKIKMSRFDKYKGLFAEQGKFDIPENYGIGIAVKAMPALTIAADIQQINYGGVKAIANTVTAGGLLGADNGPGFGWRDMTVYKLGVSYDYSKALVLRAGVSTARQPIPASQTMFNILAPGVIEKHLTFGGTWTLANKDEITFMYMHAFQKTVNGSGSLIPLTFPAGAEANIKMYQNSIGIGYGIKFD